VKRTLTHFPKHCLGWLLTREDESGHTLLCRLISWIANWGPHGTFVLLDRRDCDAGGHLCGFGVECGKPSENYMALMAERSLHFRRTMKLVEELGIVQTHIWKNPRFSAASLCSCGHPDVQGFPYHHPLCRYRVEHNIEISVEEYRALRAKELKASSYVYRWAKYLGMPVLGGTRKGQLCRVLVRGSMNSCSVEFADGFQAVTSRNALRKAKPEDTCQQSPSK
jgi:hypothetical protein